jgi:suppressor for copper-sensitivity B
MVRLFHCLIAAVMVPLLTVTANAADQRAALFNGHVELIAGGQQEDGQHYFGIQFELGEGWHTYWTNPAGSGVPPLFDFANSTNVADISVQWPVPEYYATEYATSIVYHTSVLVPILVTPIVSARPVSLALNATFGVCADVCIPEQVDLAIDSDKDLFSPMGQRAISAALSTVPAHQSDKIAIDGIHLISRNDKSILTIRATVEPSAKQVELFADGGEYLPLGRAKQSVRDGTRVEFEIYPGADIPTDAAVKLVLVSDGNALEKSLKISQ